MPDTLEAPLTPKDAMFTGDLTDELWREYDDGSRVYRIDNPKTLFIRHGGTTHRVLDSNDVVHCLLGPSKGVVLRWKTRTGCNPVAF